MGGMEPQVSHHRVERAPNEAVLYSAIGLPAAIKACLLVKWLLVGIISDLTHLALGCKHNICWHFFHYTYCKVFKG